MGLNDTVRDHGTALHKLQEEKNELRAQLYVTECEVKEIKKHFGIAIVTVGVVGSLWLLFNDAFQGGGMDHMFNEWGWMQIVGFGICFLTIMAGAIIIRQADKGKG